MTSTITLTGHSGTSYEFEVFPLQGHLPPLPVVYFVFEQEPTTSRAPARHAVYIGQSPAAADCLDDHHLQRYLANRGTHVALHVDYDDLSRAQKVADLVRALTPVCNG